MLEYYEAEKALRDLIRHTTSPDDKILARKILDLAEFFREKGEAEEMKMIIESQRIA